MVADRDCQHDANATSVGHITTVTPTIALVAVLVVTTSAACNFNEPDNTNHTLSNHGAQRAIAAWGQYRSGGTSSAGAANIDSIERIQPEAKPKAKPKAT